MEFERAIFRVYERCLEGLRDDDNEAVNSKSCRAFELLSLGGAIFFLLTLIFLHLNFVGRPGCLPMLLQERALAMNLTSSSLGRDQILQINVDRRFAPGVDDSGENSLKSMDDTTMDEGRRRFLLRGKSAINIPFNSRNVGGQIDQKVPKREKGFRNYLKGFHGILSHGLTRVGYYSSSFISAHLFGYGKIDKRILSDPSPMPTNASSNSSSNSTLPSKSTYPIRYYDFEFAYDVGILALSDEIIHTHDFEIVNVTLSGSRCFGPSVVQDLLPLGGIDTIIMNAIMYTTGRGGTLVSSSGDYYSWYNEDIKPYKTVLGWFGFKVNVLLSSLFAFFFLSSITALLVRVLISSGVVLLFPILWGLQACGVQVISARIISMSYPWIGLPMEMFRANNQSSVPFILSHITRVIIYYSLYEATQLAFSEWFYGQGRPSQRELWLFAIMMLWEYYSMIYVRSNNSIRLFPRASLALFLLYHFYLFSSPAGFHLLALLVLFLFLTALMIFCVRKFEFEAFYRGVINIEQPRMLQNNLPWPSWTVALAPDYTLFMPVTIRSASAYQHAVPPLVNTPPTQTTSSTAPPPTDVNTVGPGPFPPVVQTMDQVSHGFSISGPEAGGVPGRYQEAGAMDDIELISSGAKINKESNGTRNHGNATLNPLNRSRNPGASGGEYKYSGGGSEFMDLGSDGEEEYKRERKEHSSPSGKGRLRPALISGNATVRAGGSKGVYSRLEADKREDVDGDSADL